MSQVDKCLPSSEPGFYSQSWPDKKTFAGMELQGLGGTVEHGTSYETESEVGESRIIVRLDFNADMSREDDGTDVLNTPAGVALDIKVGGGGDGINPSVVAFRATDLGKGRTEIYVQSIPLDNTQGLTYSLEAMNGILKSVTLGEGNRIQSHDNEIAVGQSPALFTETPIYNESDVFLYNEVTITNESMISLLEKLGLPTTWRNMQKRGENSLEQAIVAPFPELLKRFEDLVTSLQSRGSGELLKLTE